MRPNDPVPRPTRRCAATGRDLLPGEGYMATLAPSPAGFSRADYGLDAWPGPPDGWIAYWPAKLPAATPDPALAFDLFCRLHAAEQTPLVYAAALRLWRQKRLKLVDEVAGVLTFKDAKSQARFAVTDPRLTPEKLTEVEAELDRLLGRDH